MTWRRKEVSFVASVIIGNQESTDEEVLGINFIVFRKIEILLRNKDALSKEVFVDFLAVRFGDEPVHRRSEFL